MTALLVFHPLLRRLYNSLVRPVASGGPSSRPTLEEAEERLDQRATFDFGFAVVFLVALHGISAFKVLLILYVNYKLATTLPRRSIPLATWVFNIGILFANDLCTGYKLSDMAWYLSGRPDASLLSDPPTLVSWGHWLDSYGGIMSRWQILFNITVLRLISFNMDYYWSLDRRSHSPVEVSRRSQAKTSDDTDSPEKKQLDPSALSENDRVSTPALARALTFRNYVAYAVYAPLYLAGPIYAPLYLTGPIITFNDFISQLRYRPATIETSRTVRYGIRFLLTLLAMEVILHFDYIQAISNSNPDWSQYTPAQLSTLSYFNLCMIWLKLLLPWRLFRLWSLVDGIDPPENMLRCVSNNYSAFSFWRSWHRSYNRWLTRYIYIPLGGSSFRDAKSTVQSLANYILTFTFVALWHDIQLKLLIWGWLIVLFMLPEAAARVFFPAHKWTHMPTTYRMMNCAAAVGNILMMMMANLVGFAVGLDGLQGIIDGILKDFWGKCAPVLRSVCQGPSNPSNPYRQALRSS